MPCHSALSKEISPTVGAEFSARAPRSIATWAAAALWTELGKRDGHRFALVLGNQIFDESGGVVETAEPRADRHRQPLRWIGRVTAARGDQRHLHQPAQAAALVGVSSGGIGQRAATVDRHRSRRQRRFDFA